MGEGCVDGAEEGDVVVLSRGGILGGRFETGFDREARVSGDGEVVKCVSGGEIGMKKWKVFGAEEGRR